MKTQFIGKTSAGIKEGYNHEKAANTFEYKADPAWKFGTNKRNTLDIKQKYIYYEFDEDDTDVLKADGERRWKNGRVVFGGSKRVSPNFKRIVPTTKINQIGPRAQIQPRLAIEL